MPAGSVVVWTVIGRILFVMTVFAACTADPPASTSWTRRASMAVPRSEIPAAADGEAIYLPGGLVATAQGTGVAASVERYRPGNDSWDTVPDLPAPRHHSMSVAFGGRIYLFGGFGDGFDPWATAWVLDPASDGWSEIADLPVATGAGAAVEIDGLIYVAGGVPGGDTLFAYDPATNVWATLPSMRQSREHTAAVAFEGDLWVMGGRWDEEMLATVEVFDPESGDWTDGPSMQEARSGFGAAVLGGNIYVAGGEVFDHTAGFEATALASVERFDGDTWIASASLPRPLHGVPLAAIGDTLYLLGGSIEAAAADNTGEVWSLRP